MGVAVLAVTAGCGGSHDPRVPSAAAGKATASAPAGQGDVATYVEGIRSWVACLRAKGIDVTDPDPTGQVTFPGDAAALKADQAFVKAQEACKSLQPPVPESVLNLRKPKLTPEQINTLRQYATCMQSNGAPDFPDPGPDGYPDRSVGWNQGSAGARHAAEVCAPILGDPTSQPTSRG